MLQINDLLAGRNAVIYGGGGSLGAAVARRLAASGATVHLCGRTLQSLRIVDEEIRSHGGKSATHVIDALDSSAVVKLLEQVGVVDISFCAIDYKVVQNVPLTSLTMEQFCTPVMIAMQSHFITATAAANIMMRQRSGVILSLTATPGGIGYPYTGGFAPACAAIESFSRNLAAELGPYQVRVVNIRSAGSPDSRIFAAAAEADPVGMTAVLKQMEADTMLKRMPMMADIANTALFLCSDHAGAISGVTIDVTAGTTAGLNYKTKV